MRHSQAKKEENRRLILQAAGQLFREHGIDGVSVADVMQAASMTHGGFYRHFADKNDLVANTLESVLEPGAELGSMDIRSYADEYLSMAHREDASGGCVFATLGPEVVRGADAPRQVMVATIRQQIEAFAQSVAGTEAVRREAAIGSWATMIGALVLARVADDETLAEEILASARQWISAGLTQTEPEPTADPRST